MKNISKCAAARKLQQCGFIVEPTPCYFNGIYIGTGFSYYLHNGGLCSVSSSERHYISTIRPGRFKTKDILNEIGPGIAQMFGIEDKAVVWEKLERWGKGPFLFLEKLERFLINPLNERAYEDAKEIIQRYSNPHAVLTDILDSERMLGNGWTAKEDNSFLYLDYSNFPEKRYRIKKREFAAFLHNCYFDTERGIYSQDKKRWFYHKHGEFSRNHFIFNSHKQTSF